LDTCNEIGFTSFLHLWWPLLLYKIIVNGFHPTTHKVSPWSSKTIILPKTRTSCYSHHMNQSTICESNWLECQDITLLESLIHYIRYFITQGISAWNFTHIPHVISEHYHLMLITLYTVPNTPHHTCTILYNIPLKSKTANHRRNQAIKHFLTSILFKLEAIA